MTDYDRGAYTPQTDAPLAFDPRRPSERRPMPMALIGSAAVLVILLAGVAMVYRGGVRHAGESPRPVGEPVMAVKTAPTPAQSAANTPPANMDVYSAAQGGMAGNTTSVQTTTAQNASTQTTTQTTSAQSSAASPAPVPSSVAKVAEAPTFTPPAEQPTARPAPKPATVAMLAKPSAPTHIERPATPDEEAVAPSGPAHKPEAAKPAKTVHAASRAKLDEAELAAAGGTRIAEAKPAASAHKAKAAEISASDATTAHKAKTVEAASVEPANSATTKTAAASTAGGKTAVVQIGAFSTSALAEKGYADVSSVLPAQMAGKAKHVQPLDKDGATLYRTWLSGFATRADAQAFCDALKAKGKTCLVKG